MKILYAIQGTGNGHISRAKEVIPALMNRAQVDVLISGTESQVELPFPVKYKFKGISFIFGKNGGINYLKTLRKNNIFRIFKEVRRCKVKEYDMVINDFEPISAWACYFKNKVCVALSHQGILRNKKVPRPAKKSRTGTFILKNYAPSLEKYGFHFKSYDKRIYPAVIRHAIRKQKIKDKRYYTVYLPAYSDDKIIKVLSKIKGIKWKVFSKYCKKPYQRKNVFIKPIKPNESFERSMAWSQGILCGAGFETPAEALFLKKKLMVVPMKGQYEQAYNAESLKRLGVPVLKRLGKKQVPAIKQWVQSDAIVDLNFPDNTQAIVDKILTNHIIATELSNEVFQGL
ncbi:MAG: glycosyltransferase family protein [Flavobacteriaceae bacterium]|nr:glycosyltransferase family protein [Flavobacteriaceae bacterium]